MTLGWMVGAGLFNGKRVGGGFGTRDWGERFTGVLWGLGFGCWVVMDAVRSVGLRRLFA